MRVEVLAALLLPKHSVRRPGCYRLLDLLTGYKPASKEELHLRKESEVDHKLIKSATCREGRTRHANNCFTEECNNGYTNQYRT